MNDSRCKGVHPSPARAGDSIAIVETNATITKPKTDLEAFEQGMRLMKSARATAPGGVETPSPHPEG